MSKLSSQLWSLILIRPSAGIAAFVKASYMRSVNDTTGDFSRKFHKFSDQTANSADSFSDGGAQLAVWAAAETAITIMVATLPVLRVLLRDTAVKTRYLPDAIKMKVRKSTRRSERVSRRSVEVPEDKMHLASSGASMSTAGASSSTSGGSSRSADSQKTLIGKPKEYPVPKLPNMI